MNTTRSLHILKTLSYILAGLVLVVGLVAGISLLASASNVHNLLLPLLLLGNQVIINLVAPLVRNLVIWLGVLVLTGSLLLSLLLFSSGRLLGHIASLEERLRRLEAQMGPER